MRRITWFMAAVALAAFLASGCSGILAEKTTNDGKLERIRLDTGTKWSVYDKNATKQDETAIFLKKESTF
jgi:hypothetical protein